MLKFIGWLLVVLVALYRSNAFELGIADFPNEGDFYNDTFVVGDSVVNKTLEICRLRDRSFCYNLQDKMTMMYDGISYTPSLPHHTSEDFRMGRTKLVKYLVERFHYKSYLEVGCGGNKTFINNSLLFTDYAFCVDPATGGTHRMTSDEYFATNTLTYDVIFIDGLHDAVQVLKDVENAREVLNPGGMFCVYEECECRLVLISV